MSEATPIGSGRYGLLGTLSTTLPRIVRHRGVDTILDRDVTILVLTDATLHRDNVLESASRAVLVEDQRLQQVYDVERAEPSVIVTEPLTGRTFSSLVSRGMPPAQARAIIGETAQALDAGARKGLHHLNLSPESIRVLPDGTVKVSGLGIEAAALDLRNQATVLRCIRDLADENHGVIMTSHSPDHAFLVATRAVLITRNREILSGPVNEVLTEANLQAAYGTRVQVLETTSPDGEAVRTCIPTLELT